MTAPERVRELVAECRFDLDNSASQQQWFCLWRERYATLVAAAEAWADAQGRIAELERENARLRGALNATANCGRLLGGFDAHGIKWTTGRALDEACQIARAALERGDG